jgi:SsrA-binding protein
MARRKKDNAKSRAGSNDVRIANRKARHSYHILESLEVGIELTGSEVKSVRNGQVSLAEGFARIDPHTDELFLHDVHIAEYVNAPGAFSHDPTRTRKLLAHRREINKLKGKLTNKGHTLVPLAMYFNSRGFVKVDLGLGIGKKQFDKREDVKSRDAKRDMRRAMTRKIL